MSSSSSSSSGSSSNSRQTGKQVDFVHIYIYMKSEDKGFHRLAIDYYIKISIDVTDTFFGKYRMSLIESVKYCFRRNNR